MSPLLETNLTNSERPARAHVVGNLPYYLTSDILLRLFEFHDQFDVIVIMVQREVAERIAAAPGSQVRIALRHRPAVHES
jgi:16S rRNA A1518/A1519 N6-dimethyltransferase RsmA/KsgA/DIM1 with predicted DNA glycosylase/AP lyase activity